MVLFRDRMLNYDYDYVVLMSLKIVENKTCVHRIITQQM